MTDQQQNDVPLKAKQKVAREVEVTTAASEDYENPEDPLSEDSEVRRSGIASPTKDGPVIVQKAAKK